MNKKVVGFIVVGIVCLIAGAILSRLLLSPKEPDKSEIEKYLDTRFDQLEAEIRFSQDMVLNLQDSINKNNVALSKLKVAETNITKNYYDEISHLYNLPNDSQVVIFKRNGQLMVKRLRSGYFNPRHDLGADDGR